MTSIDLPEVDCIEFLTTRLYFLKDKELRQLPPGKKAAIYGVSIRNISDSPVRIIGRKWIMNSSNREVDVIEGDNLFGSRPLLLPGQIFAVKGFHLVEPPVRISLTLIGRDDNGHIFQTPPYRLKRPQVPPL